MKKFALIVFLFSATAAYADQTPDYLIQGTVTMIGIGSEGNVYISFSFDEVDATRLGFTPIFASQVILPDTFSITSSGALQASLTRNVDGIAVNLIFPDGEGTGSWLQSNMPYSPSIIPPGPLGFGNFQTANCPICIEFSSITWTDTATVLPEPGESLLILIGLASLLIITRSRLMSRRLVGVD